MFTMINLIASNIETLNLKSMELDGEGWWWWTERQDKLQDYMSLYFPQRAWDVLVFIFLFVVDIHIVNDIKS